MQFKKSKLIKTNQNYGLRPACCKRHEHFSLQIHKKEPLLNSWTQWCFARSPQNRHKVLSRFQSSQCQSKFFVATINFVPFKKHVVSPWRSTHFTNFLRCFACCEKYTAPCNLRWSHMCFNLLFSRDVGISEKYQDNRDRILLIMFFF